MIPPIIHYCWFGHGEMPPLMKRCLKSWKRNCPDWQIIQWNEDNFDVNSTVWTKQAYEAKKYAFVSDYVRLKVLTEMGGVYVDTDLQLLKPLTPYIEHDMFVGFENRNSVASCIIGAKANHLVIAAWLEYYSHREFFANGQMHSEPNVVFMTNDLIARGLVMDNTRQNIDGVDIYPQSWFCPQNMEGENRKRDNNTVAVHHFTSTWRSAQGRKSMKRLKWHSSKLYKILLGIRIFPGKIARKILGNDTVERIKRRIE
ncbi:MAG: glycosyl transferase [Oscillospiraceae bacterium]|nr:glycosyl transferase [Oscillospiraceae bacterium]